MPKLKSHKGAAKRFKVTGNGKIKRRRAFKSHILEKKSAKRKRKFKKEFDVHPSNRKSIRRLISNKL